MTGPGAAPPTLRGSPPRRVVRFRPWETALIAALLATGAAVAGDRWYAGNRLALARERVDREATAMATSLESVINRRMTVLHGLGSFLRLRYGLPHAAEDFDIFAEGILRGVPGLRTVQFDSAGVIVHTYPLAGNEAALGRNLFREGESAVARDFRRALDTTGIVVSGPLHLFQGGEGLVGRLAVRLRPESVLVVAAAVMDFGTILDESGLAAAGTRLDLRLRNGADSLLWSGGDGAPVADPVIVPVAIPGQRWILQAAPVGGWAAAAVADRDAYRVVAGVMVLLLTGMVWGRQAWQGARVESGHVRELSRAEEKFRHLFQLVPDGVILTRRRDGVILEVNDAYCAIVHRPRESLVGRTTTDLGIWGRAEDREAVLEALARNHPVREFPFLVALPEGMTREAVVSSRSIVFDGEEALLGVVRDVHDRLRLERRVVEGQRLEAVGRLAGGVAHDFNNLITGVSGYADLLLGELPEADPRRHEVDEILRACGRAADLTRQLLTFARRQVVLPRLVDLNRVLADAESLLARLAGNRVALHVERETATLPVLIDPAQFEQVLTNLAVNARDAMPDGGALRIRTWRDGSHAILAVRDEGVGIAAEAIPHLFEPFYTTKAPGKGTGLGLATVYGIMEQAGGRIEVQSAPGKGATFRIVLPIAPGDAPGEVDSARSGPLPRGHETVLIVDDEPQIRGLGERLLERLGYRALTAADGREALQRLAARGDIALVLTDMVMPGMGGWDLVTALRNHGVVLPIIVMSGYSDELVAALDEVHFLAKPFTAMELAVAVRTALDGGQPPRPEGGTPAPGPPDRLQR